jgi:hypothetical protein
MIDTATSKNRNFGAFCKILSVTSLKGNFHLISC